MPGGTTVPYKKTKHKTFNAFCIQLAFLVNPKSQTGSSRSGVWLREARCHAGSRTRAPRRRRGEGKSKGHSQGHSEQGHGQTPRGEGCTRALSAQRWGPQDRDTADQPPLLRAHLLLFIINISFLFSPILKTVLNLAGLHS